MIIYIFGGYLVTEGEFQGGEKKGTKWQSLNIFIGKSYGEKDPPRSTVILKADKKLLEFVQSLERGCKLTLGFDEHGRVNSMTYIN